MAVSLPSALMRPFAALLVAAVLLGSAVTPVDAGGTQFSRVSAIARDQIGDPWVWGRTGPASFDCVGLVYYVFKRAGIAYRIGGWRTVSGYRSWFAARGRVSRRNARRGDLVIWGNNKHIGIYLGDGKAISALLSGVRIHGLHQLTDSFTTFLHVRMTR